MSVSKLKMDSPDMTTPLMQAIQFGDAGIARAIIHADRRQVNMADKNGRTPLAVAIDQNRLDIFDLLIRFGADINAVLKDRFFDNGITILEYALRRIPRSHYMVETLRSFGARMNDHAPKPSTSTAPPGTGI